MKFRLTIVIFAQSQSQYHLHCHLFTISFLMFQMVSRTFPVVTLEICLFLYPYYRDQTNPQLKEGLGVPINGH